MEKQPIDDFFARKLREAELLPGADTFSRLQRRMVSSELPATKKQTVVWWYGAAAASLLLIALFYFRSSSSVKQIGLNQVARQTKGTRPAPNQQPTHQVTDAGMERTAQTASIVAKQDNNISERHKESTDTPIKQIRHQEKVESVTMVEKKPAQKVIIQSPELTATTIKNESVAVVANPTGSPQTSEPKETVTAGSSDHQRVVIMTIEAPKTDESIVALQPTKIESPSQTQLGSLAGLFAKVKQLKNGDVLAHANTIKRPTESRSRIGRVFEEMKESLKNETTLD